MGERYEYQYSSSEIAEFESRHRVLLPEAYRAYLLAFPFHAGSVISILTEWCQPYFEDEMPDGFLAQTFPHTTAWNEKHLFDRAKGWNSEYYAKSHFQGSMRIGNLGCEEYALLVVSGRERGNIWIDARASRQAGIYPMRSSDGGRVSFSLFIRLQENNL